MPVDVADDQAVRLPLRVRVCGGWRRPQVTRHDGEVLSCAVYYHRHVQPGRSVLLTADIGLQRKARCDSCQVNPFLVRLCPPVHDSAASFQAQLSHQVYACTASELLCQWREQSLGAQAQAQAKAMGPLFGMPEPD